MNRKSPIFFGLLFVTCFIQTDFMTKLKDLGLWGGAMSILGQSLLDRENAKLLASRINDGKRENAKLIASRINDGKIVSLGSYRAALSKLDQPFDSVGSATNALIDYAEEIKDFGLVEELIRVDAINFDSNNFQKKLLKKQYLGEQLSAWAKSGESRLPMVRGRLSLDNHRLPKEQSTPVDPESSHVPIIFLIEQNEQSFQQYDADKLFFSINQDALFDILKQEVIWGQKLVVVSKELTCQLLSAAYESDKSYVTALRDKIINNWVIYRVPDTQFTVWLPNQDDKVSHYYQNILNIKGLPEKKIKPFRLLSVANKEDILQFCPSQFISSSKLFDLKSKYMVPHKYEKGNLEKIFNIGQLKNKIVDVYLVGHGRSSGWKKVGGGPVPALIGGLPVSQYVPEKNRLTSFLTFFDKKVKTGLVYINSCRAGGKNRDLVQVKNDGIVLDYDYILILAASSDKVVTSHFVQSLLARDRFFSKAKNISSRGSEVKEMLKEIMSFELISRSLDVQGYASLAQVWFPRQIGFQTLDVDEAVSSIGKVDVAVHEEESRPIIINKAENNLIVLWYSRLVNIPVKVFPARKTNISSTKSTVFSESWPDGLKLVDDKDISDLIIYPEFLLMGEIGLLSQLSKEVFSEEKISSYWGFFKKFFSKKEINPRLQQFKNVFSDEEINSHWQLFKKIELQDKSSSGGVLRFLRDSFGNLKGARENRYIFIETLSGNNDLTENVQKANPDSSLLNDLPMVEDNKPIVLQDIFIDFKFFMWRLTFKYNNAYWTYTADLRNKKTTAWAFKKLNGQELSKFTSRIIELGQLLKNKEKKQKSITEALKEKLNEKTLSPQKESPEHLYLDDVDLS